VQIGAENDGEVWVSDWQIGAGDPVLFNGITDVTTDVAPSAKPEGVRGTRLPEGTKVEILQDGEWQAIAKVHP
jgi:hypothetical protein